MGKVLGPLLLLAGLGVSAGVFVGTSGPEGLGIILDLPVGGLVALVTCWVLSLTVDGLVLRSLEGGRILRGSQGGSLWNLGLIGLVRIYLNMVSPFAMAGHVWYLHNLGNRGMGTGMATGITMVKMNLFSLVLAFLAGGTLLARGFLGLGWLDGAPVLLGAVSLALALALGTGLFWLVVFVRPMVVLGPLRILGRITGRNVGAALKKLRREARRCRAWFRSLGGELAGHLAAAVAWDLILVGCQMAMVMVIIWMLGGSPPIGDLVLRSILLVMLLNNAVVPGNIGVAEFGMVGVMTGILPAESLALGALVWRVANQGLVLLGGAVALPLVAVRRKEPVAKPAGDLVRNS